MCSNIEKTFDYLPPESVGYPFIFVGEDFSFDRETKSTILGTYTKKVHVYHTRDKRGDLYRLINDIKYSIRQLNNTKNFYMSVKGINDRVIVDNTTAIPLLHGIIEITINFN